jgi:uncharacterized phage infection (PIP) family protein YhgE
MLIPKNHGFKRKYVIGGSGIFDSISSIATKVQNAAAIANQLAQKAINVSIAGPELTPKAQSIIAKYTTRPEGSTKPSALTDGSGVDAIAIQDLVRKLNRV